jgi:hypothetical protein
MELREVRTSGEYVGTMKPGEDWRAEIEAMALATEADAAWFSAIGGVRDAELSYYDQSGASYGPTYFDEPMEVAACAGNVARIDDDSETTFAHTHAVLAQEDGTVVAGHLTAATVFVGEVYLRAFDGEFTRAADETPVLQTDEQWRERTHPGESAVDPVTGLRLWSR